MAYALYQTIVILLDVLWWIIIIQAVMSWLIAFNVVNMGSDFVRTVMVALDLTPMVVLLGILIIRQAILPPLFSSLM